MKYLEAIKKYLPPTHKIAVSFFLFIIFAYFVFPTFSVPAWIIRGLALFPLVISPFILIPQAYQSIQKYPYHKFLPWFFGTGYTLAFSIVCLSLNADISLVFFSAFLGLPFVFLSFIKKSPVLLDFAAIILIVLVNVALKVLLLEHISPTLLFSLQLSGSILLLPIFFKKQDYQANADNIKIFFALSLVVLVWLGVKNLIPLSVTAELENAVKNILKLAGASPYFFSIAIFWNVLWLLGTYEYSHQELNKKNDVRADHTAIDKPKHDKLGRIDFVNSVFTAIRNYKAKDSLVIGLEGSWGSGKTSILNMLKHTIDNYTDNENEHKYVVMPFNPWAIDHEGFVAREFLEMFLHDTDEVFKDNTVDSLPKLSSSITNALFNESPIKVLQGFIQNFFQRKKNLLTPYELKEIKDKVAQRLTNNNIRLIVFMDNLDRLTKDEAVSMMRILKENLDFENTIFVLSYDRSVLGEQLDRAFSNGDTFLQKVINRQISVPAMTQEGRQKFFDDLLKKVASGDLIKALPENFDTRSFTALFGAKFSIPRNIILYTKRLEQNFHALNGKINMLDFCHIEFLSLFYSPVMKFIISNEAYFLADTYEQIQNRPEAPSFDILRDKFEKIIQGYPPLEQEYIKHIIAEVFYQSIKITKFSHTQALHPKNLNKLKRLYNSKYWFIYKTQTQEQDALSPRDKMLDLLKLLVSEQTKGNPNTKKIIREHFWHKITEYNLTTFIEVLHSSPVCLTPHPDTFLPILKELFHFLPNLKRNPLTGDRLLECTLNYINKHIHNSSIGMEEFWKTVSQCHVSGYPWPAIYEAIHFLRMKNITFNQSATYLELQKKCISRLNINDRTDLHNLFTNKIEYKYMPEVLYMLSKTDKNLLGTILQREVLRNKEFINTISIKILQLNHSGKHRYTQEELKKIHESIPQTHLRGFLKDYYKFTADEIQAFLQDPTQYTGNKYYALAYHMSR